MQRPGRRRTWLRIIELRVTGNRVWVQKSARFDERKRQPRGRADHRADPSSPYLAGSTGPFPRSISPLRPT
ncbi:hypothetical protein GCM10023108_44450 [Saccharopolyspora hordei]